MLLFFEIQKQAGGFQSWINLFLPRRANTLRGSFLYGGIFLEKAVLRGPERDISYKNSPWNRNKRQKKYTGAKSTKLFGKIIDFLKNPCIIKWGCNRGTYALMPLKMPVDGVFWLAWEWEQALSATTDFSPKLPKDARRVYCGRKTMAKRLKTVRFSYSGDGKNEDKG